MENLAEARTDSRTETSTEVLSLFCKAAADKNFIQQVWKVEGSH
jgi:hypothetical protein